MSAVDRFKAAIVAVIAELIPERRFLSPIAYRVSKAEGGKFSARPDDDTFPPIVDAPIRGSIAGGMQSKLTKGTPIVVMFVRDRLGLTPILIAIEKEPDELALKASTTAKIDAPQVVINGGVQGAARIGDLVAGIFPITTGSPTTRIG